MKETINKTITLLKNVSNHVLRVAESQGTAARRGLLDFKLSWPENWINALCNKLACFEYQKSLLS